MAYIVDLTTHTDKRGNLTVIEKEVPFEIKRIFYIYGVDASERGNHRHHKTIQAVICLKGTCKVYNNNSKEEEIFNLDLPSKALILHPEDWHKIFALTADAIMMVLASEYYDALDYIYEPYE